MRGKAKPEWTALPERVVDAFTKAAESVSGVAVRQMFGHPAAFLEGNMFAGIFQNCVILKLPEQMREGLVEQGGRPFEPEPGQVMREYVVLPESVALLAQLLDDWISEAASYARILPPKASPGSPREG